MAIPWRGMGRGLGALFAAGVRRAPWAAGLAARELLPPAVAGLGVQELLPERIDEYQRIAAGQGAASATSLGLGLLRARGRPWLKKAPALLPGALIGASLVPTLALRSDELWRRDQLDRYLAGSGPTTQRRVPTELLPSWPSHARAAGGFVPGEVGRGFLTAPRAQLAPYYAGLRDAEGRTGIDVAVARAQRHLANRPNLRPDLRARLEKYWPAWRPEDLDRQVPLLIGSQAAQTGNGAMAFNGLAGGPLAVFEKDEDDLLTQEHELTHVYEYGDRAPVFWGPHRRPLHSPSRFAPQFPGRSQPEQTAKHELQPGEMTPPLKELGRWDTQVTNKDVETPDDVLQGLKRTRIINRHSPTQQYDWYRFFQSLPPEDQELILQHGLETVQRPSAQRGKFAADGDVKQPPMPWWARLHQRADLPPQSPLRWSIKDPTGRSLPLESLPTQP